MKTLFACHATILAVGVFPCPPGVFETVMIRRNALPLLLGFLILIPCFVQEATFAQEATPPDPDVQKQLQQLQDGTRPAEYRLQMVNRLLREGRPGARDGLRAVLVSEEAPADLKLIVITGVLYHDTGLTLLDDALDATAAADDTFIEQVRKKVAWARSPGLVKGLAARATGRGRPETLRLVAIGLLGASAAKEAVSPLISLWEGGPAPFAEAARRALDEVLPLHFHSASEAREFWTKNSARDMETILREGLRAAGTGNGNGTHKQLLINLARSLLPDASLTAIVAQYLGCREFPELRRMGANRIGVYPFGEFAGGAAAGRKAAAAGVLKALAVEDVPEVELALLRAARSLIAELKEGGTDRIRELCLARLDSRSAEVRLAAVQVAGELRDHAALEVLTARYDSLDGKDKVIRLAILDAVGQSENGNAAWVHEKLMSEVAEEDVVFRLIQILKKYQNRPDSKPMTFVPTLIEILKDKARSARIRQETATAIGAIGVLGGNRQAIDALALFGLADEDLSVRDIAATQLGRAPEVDGKVVEMLRARLTEVEKEPRVRQSAARSLLNLRGAAAVPYLKTHLAEDSFWQETVRSYLSQNLLGGGDAAGAVDLVEALCKEGFEARCAEAARLVLEHKDLKWEGAPPGAKEATAFLLARSLGATGRDAEGLKVLTESVPETFPFDPEGVERALLHAQLLRKTGAPGQVAAALAKMARSDKLPAGTPARIAIETGLALIDLGRSADAVKVLKPHTTDTAHGKRVQEILAKAEGVAKVAPPRRPLKPEELTPVLDGPDAAKRSVAVSTLKKIGKAAHPALIAWITRKKPSEVPAAMGILKEITGISVPFDPRAPESERRKALAVLAHKLAK